MKKEIVLSNVFNYTSAENNLNKRFDKSATIFKNKLYNILQKKYGLKLEIYHFDKDVNSHINPSYDLTIMLQEAKEKPFICLSIYSSGKIYFSIHRFIYLRASLLGHRDYQNDDELIEKNKKLYSISKKVYTGEEFNKIIKYFPRFLKSE